MVTLECISLTKLTTAGVDMPREDAELPAVHGCDGIHPKLKGEEGQR